MDIRLEGGKEEETCSTVSHLPRSLHVLRLSMYSMKPTVDPRNVVTREKLEKWGKLIPSELVNNIMMLYFAAHLEHLTMSKKEKNKPLHLLLLWCGL